MKYLRKIIWLIIAVVFFASVLIGMGIIFAVKNVNVTLENYSWSDWDDMTEEEEQEAIAEINGIKDIVLGRYGGKLITTVSADGISAALSQSNYILESCEKVYPCTLNITVKERREVFYVQSGNYYNTYDSFGTLMRSNLTEEEAAANDIDSAPNVEILVNSESEIVKIASAAQVFAEEFSSLRSVVRDISTRESVGSALFINFRCGLVLEIHDYEYVTREKIKAAYKVFNSLTGEEKLSSIITVIGRSAESVSAMYLPKETEKSSNLQ